MNPYPWKSHFAPVVFVESQLFFPPKSSNGYPLHNTWHLGANAWEGWRWLARPLGWCPKLSFKKVRLQSLFLVESLLFPTLSPYHPCMVYLDTYICLIFMVNVGKSTSPMDAKRGWKWKMGPLEIHQFSTEPWLLPNGRWVLKEQIASLWDQCWAWSLVFQSLKRNKTIQQKKHLSLSSKYLLRRCFRIFRYVFGVQAPPLTVFGSLLVSQSLPPKTRCKLMAAVPSKKTQRVWTIYDGSKPWKIPPKILHSPLSSKNIPQN